MYLQLGMTGINIPSPAMQNPVNGYNLGYNINQSNFKGDFHLLFKQEQYLKLWLSAPYIINCTQANFEPYNNQSLVVPDVVPAEQALENALYTLGDKYDITSMI